MYENKVEDILKAQSGNKEIMTKLVTENSNLIWSIVTRFKDRGYEIEDLYQIGCIGFIKSIKRFDTNYEVKLSTYAVPYMIGEIKRHIRDDGPVKVSRSIKELGIKIKEINIYDNDRNNGFTLAGNLVKYSVDMATRYGLNEKYAYDYVKPNIRQKKYK